MKKGNLGFSHWIAAILVIFLIISVLWFFTPIFDEVKEKLGFFVNLTPSELESQTQAIENFNGLVNTFDDCINSYDSGCFCTNKTMAFPTDYYLTFEEKGIKLEVTLYNQYDGLLRVESFLTNPCIGSNFIKGEQLHYFNGILKDNFLTIVYKSPSLLRYINIQEGIEKIINNEEIDIGYTFFKPNNDSLCILSLEKSVFFRVNETVCS